MGNKEEFYLSFLS